MLICKKKQKFHKCTGNRHDLASRNLRLHSCICNAVLICDPSRLNGNYKFLQKPNTKKICFKNFTLINVDVYTLNLCFII